jgi:hypothetical protein
MKRLLYTTSLFAIIASSATAQTTFTAQAGVVNSNWIGDALKSLNNVVDLTNGFIDTRSKTSFTVGGYASIPVAGSTVYIEPGINYTQKGYAMLGDLKIDALKFLGVNAGARVEAHYIDIPVYVKVQPVKGLSIYAGPQVSYLVKNNLRVNADVLGISLFNRRLDITDNFNRVDVGIGGGVGYQFQNGLGIRAGYDRGLTRLDKNENFRAYNSAIKLTVGFTF